MRRAIVVGFEYPSNYLVRLMREQAAGWKLKAYPQTHFGIMRALWSLRSADALISFGGPGPNAALALAARQQKVPLVVIWAGTDVLSAGQHPFELEVSKRDTSADLAVSPWLADELRAIGVPARYQPVISADVEPSMKPFPSRFTVLSYLPAPRRAFYGEDRVYDIARAMSDARFLIVGNGPRNPSAPSNVEFLGQLARTDSAIDDSTVLLRIPEHDGQSMMVLEAMARGRYVVWTYGLPGVEVASTTQNALSALSRLRDLHAARSLEPNAIGRAYVAEYCSRAGVARSFASALDAVVAARIAPANGHRKRVAISGYGLFCADAARNIEALHPEWEAQILRPRSRVEALSAFLHIGRAHVWYTIGSPMESRWMHYGARLLGVPRVMHWVGSDIERARTDRSLRRAVQACRATHLAEIDWTARELQALGLNPKIVPLPVRHEGSGVKPLPTRFTMLFYIPASRSEFYGRREYERLLEELDGEDVSIFVVGGGTIKAPASLHVVNYGWRNDLREIYERTTVLVRCTPHDGLALMVIEALSFGRHVIWSRPFRYVNQVSNYSELVTALRMLLEQHKQGGLFAQYAASEMACERYATERCVDDIIAVFEAVRAPGKRAEEAR